MGDHAAAIEEAGHGRSLVCKGAPARCASLPELSVTSPERHPRSLSSSGRPTARLAAGWWYIGPAEAHGSTTERFLLDPALVEKAR